MSGAGLSALLSHWRKHPVQLAMLLLGLALATALWSAVQTINSEARASYARAAAMLAQDRLSQIVAVHGGMIDQQIFVDLRRAGYLVSPVVEGELRLGGERFRLIGIDPLSLPPEAQPVKDMAGDGLLPFIAAPGLWFTSTETASRLAGLTKTPIRASDGVPPGTIIADIGQAQKLLHLEMKLSRLLLWPEQLPDLAPLADIAPGLVIRMPEAAGGLDRLTDSFHLNLTAFGFLSFAVGLFIVHAAIGLAFEQRRQMFRTLRALGLPLRRLVLLLFAEILIMAMVAGLAGIVLGYVIAAALLPDVAATLKGLYGADVAGSISVRPGVWAFGLSIAVVGTLVSAAQSLWRVWHLPLLAPAQAEAWVRASGRALRLQALAGLVLLAAAAGLALFGSGLAAGFALLGTLLLGAALLLPMALSAVLMAGVRFSRGAVTQWFWADTRQQLPGLSLALMALLLALSTNVGVGTMVASFRLTFIGWLDQRLASELYVRGRDEAEAARMRDWLASRSDAVLPIWQVEGVAAGWPAEIYGIVDHPTYREKWPLISARADVWERVAAGEGLLVNEQLWRRGGLELGQGLTLSGGLTMPVAGIYSDYGNPLAQVIIGNDILTRHYPQVQKLRYGVRVAPKKAAALAESLRETFDLPPEAVVDQASIKAFSLGVFERTFAITAALNVLTLGVAGVAIFASLLTLATMRLPNLAPVWAMGLTLRRLALLELLRCLMLAALTMVAAVPVGMALAWALLAVVNVEAFGWRLPLHAFPAQWSRLGVMAMLAAGIAAALPAWWLARTPPARLAKVFAHER